MFQLATREGVVAEIIRTRIAPHARHAILGLELTRQAAFRMIGQLEIAYRDSELSAGKAGKLRGGDRLPWLAGVDNFAPLASRAWQLHVYGDVSAALRATGLPLHVFAWGRGRRGRRARARRRVPDPPRRLHRLGGR